jgi:calcineurin-like phosphoesterase family protein
MPDPAKLLHTIGQATSAFRQTPGRQGRFVELQDVEDILVAGDLHGHVDNFKRVLQLADLSTHPERHLVLQELVHGPFRYPQTGGDQSHRLLDLVAALKCQYPRQIHVLIGNHELSQWTERAIIKNDEDLNQLFRLGVETAYGTHAEAVYAAYGLMIEAMAVALRAPNRVFLSHSLPGASRLDTWELSQLQKDEYSEEDHKLGGCIHAVVWGRDISQPTVERYLAKVDCDLLVSGHIPCEDGYMTPNDRQLILDCKDAKACCCLAPIREGMGLPDLVRCLVRLRESA